ncbi:enoyl-CoA hydratase [Glaciecola sp. 1036]|uniref:enoyl-CoA hydratase n=1 Tax=Alteromonadaceae TaxID=72275 RepID=UPI003D01ADA5
MIASQITESILNITINRPEKKNALTPAMYQSMADALNSAEEQGARVVVIKGCQGIFTSGNDVTEFMQTPTEEGANEISETYQFMQALLNCPLPVIAKVEGLAIGIGTTLLLHCDFVLADKNTKFSMPFINLGLVPEYASSFLVPRLAGQLAAAELLMLGEVFTASKALECRLISQVCENDLQNRVDQLAKKLAAKPAEALKQTKRLLHSETDKVRVHIDEELKHFVAAMQSPPAKEAFSAFVEKRAINFDIFR